MNSSSIITMTHGKVLPTFGKQDHDMRWRSTNLQWPGISTFLYEYEYLLSIKYLLSHNLITNKLRYQYNEIKI